MRRRREREGDGNNQELLLPVDGYCFRRLLGSELQRTQHQEAHQHQSRRRQAHRGELSQAQEGRR